MPPTKLTISSVLVEIENVCKRILSPFCVLNNRPESPGCTLPTVIVLGTITLFNTELPYLTVAKRKKGSTETISTIEYSCAPILVLNLLYKSLTTVFILAIYPSISLTSIDRLTPFSERS